MISIVDYGLGNISAIVNIYRNLDIPVLVATKEADLEEATKLILPGVGSFDWAMEKINNSGLRQKLDFLVLKKKTPILGICVGMQMMCNKSEEGKQKGLGWINADVLKFNLGNSKQYPLPHMGWNAIEPIRKDSIFESIGQSYFYFLHSYYCKVLDTEMSLAFSTYNIKFTSSFCFQNIYGVQFHPEKSHKDGIKLLKNFYYL